MSPLIIGRIIMAGILTGITGRPSPGWTGMLAGTQDGFIGDSPPPGTGMISILAGIPGIGIGIQAGIILVFILTITVIIHIITATTATITGMTRRKEVSRSFAETSLKDRLREELALRALNPEKLLPANS